MWIGLGMALGVLLGSKLSFVDSTDQLFTSNSKKDKLNRLIDYIDYEYVDQVNTDSIVDITVSRILENLDPHSVYIPKKSYAKTSDDMRGAFTGIGVSFYIYRDTIAVIQAVSGGPAKEAGIEAGDRILEADGKKLYGSEINNDSVAKYLQGIVNSKVALTIYRPKDGEIIEKSLRRKEIPLKSIDASYMLSDELGYIKINRFSETTFEEFDSALKGLIKQHATRLVLDLRDNPGGYISSAEKIIDEFLEKNKLILITKNKNGDVTKTFSTKRGDFKEGELYVLINENSASASEIVAGAIQDNDKGTIIGRRSFGKGLVQREMSLGDGSAIRLTVARYYTPTGRSIQRTYGEGNKAYYQEYENRYQNGEMISADSIKVADSLKYFTPQGRVVYGGGGIIPDVFVPKDISIENEHLEIGLKRGYMSYYVFEFLDRHRDMFIDLSFEDYLTNFEVDDALAIDFLLHSGFGRTGISMSNHGAELKQMLKAVIAQQLYGDNEYEIILNRHDPMILKVLELEASKFAQEH